MSQISIILPTYNVEKYIARALESCINQTFKDIEIIVVDDCGNDKSIDIAKEYASKDDRIKIIHNEENLKLLRARYEGVKVATSPYIMFLDPDDYLELNACEECVKILDKQKVDLICFNYYECDDYKKEWNFFESAFYNNENFCYFLFSRYPKFSWSIANKVLKKELYLKAFNTINLQPNEKNTMAEDFLLVLHSLKFINAFGTTKQYLYNYNISNENSSTREKKDLNKIKSYIHDLSFVLEKISNLTQNQTNKLHSLIFKIAIYDLNIHKIDLTYKYTNKNFFEKIFLKIQRKKIKIKKNIQIKNVKNILKEANVSHCF
ncbi:glycosyltransferase family 2 protein [Campylobacter sp. LMG 7929]|uniref:glycosyltransferase family 2 protein n=1 Tax=Campylobacter sp. LMG 7929 TaxID=2735749 RepID=UPI00301BD040|nr:glycosyltransferase family 2 protein [Campylobacter sp. LMG 7929]